MVINPIPGTGFEAAIPRQQVDSGRLPTLVFAANPGLLFHTVEPEFVEEKHAARLTIADQDEVEPAGAIRPQRLIPTRLPVLGVGVNEPFKRDGHLCPGAPDRRRHRGTENVARFARRRGSFQQQYSRHRAVDQLHPEFQHPGIRRNGKAAPGDSAVLNGPREGEFERMRPACRVCTEMKLRACRFRVAPAAPAADRPFEIVDHTPGCTTQGQRNGKKNPGSLFHLASFRLVQARSSSSSVTAPGCREKEMFSENIALRSNIRFPLPPLA